MALCDVCKYRIRFRAIRLTLFRRGQFQCPALSERWRTHPPGESGRGAARCAGGWPSTSAPRAPELARPSTGTLRSSNHQARVKTMGTWLYRLRNGFKYSLCTLAGHSPNGDCVHCRARICRCPDIGQHPQSGNEHHTAELCSLLAGSMYLVGMRIASHTNIAAIVSPWTLDTSR